MSITITDLPSLTTTELLTAVVDTSVNPPTYDYIVSLVPGTELTAWIAENRSKFDVLGNQVFRGRLLRTAPVRIYAALRSREELTFPTGTEQVNRVLARGLFGVWAGR
jgi:hypothetical protein